MTNSWFGREDPNLTEKLLAERPGIFNMALDALDRLRERGKFLQPESGREMAESLGDLSSDVALFVKECCELDSEARVMLDTLFQAYREWCGTQGFRCWWASQQFSEKLLAAQSQLKRVRPRTTASRKTFIAGIALRKITFSGGAKP